MACVSRCRPCGGGIPLIDRSFLDETFTPDPTRQTQMMESVSHAISCLSPATTTATLSSLGSGSDMGSSTTSHTPDVSGEEAQFYYAGLHSGPRLLYRTGKEQWSRPTGPEAYRHLKELCEVFDHPIVEVWNHGLGWEVVKLMDAHTVS